MAKHSFILNGERVTVDCPGDVRLLWVIRDLLGVRGPKYGCGINVCKACTCHINGRAFNPCSVPVSKIKRSDRITTIEGLPATVGKPLHPMQEAWLKLDVAQCGYCQPGQIMAAVSRVNEVRRRITNKDIEEIRNVCRCGTYPRIREAIKEGAKHMPTPKQHHA
jgi:isoquinoline 1-oxidoreductase alpha subunit